MCRERCGESVPQIYYQLRAIRPAGPNSPAEEQGVSTAQVYMDPPEVALPTYQTTAWDVVELDWVITGEIARLWVGLFPRKTIKL